MGTKHLPNIYQTFTKHLPTIYQRFTKNKAIFSILPSKIYQGFTKDLPKIYQRLTPKIYQRFIKSTKHLPKAIKYFFNLPKIYQRFTNNLPKMFGQKYFDTSILYFLKNI